MELRRILSKNNIILVCIALVVNFGLFTYGTTQGWRFGEARNKAHHYDSAVAELEHMTCDEALAYIKENKLTVGNAVYKDIRTKLNYIKGYRESIRAVIERADTLQNDVLFSDKTSFSYNNIIKTEKDFAKLLTVQPTLDNDFAVEAVADYFYCFPIALLVILMIVAGLYRERDNGMWQLAYTGSHGRLVLAVKRGGIILLVALAVLGLLYGSTVVTALLIFGGTGELGGPIQNIEAFGQSVYPVSKLEYLLINFLWSYASVMAITAIVYLLFTVCRNKKNVAIGITAFTIVEYLLYTKLESQSVYGIFKNINLLNLFKMSDICMRYKNTGSGTLVIQIGSLLLIVLLAVTVAALVASSVIYMRMHPNMKVGLITKFFGRINEFYQKILGRMPPVLKELHKTVFTAKGVWLLAGVILAAAYFSSTGFIRFDDYESANDEMYLKHGGREYSYIKDYTNDIIHQYTIVSEQYATAVEQYQNGEIGMGELYAAASTYEYFGTLYNGVAEFNEKMIYLDVLEKERGIKGYMMSDRGYYQAFGEDARQREIIIFSVLQMAMLLIAVAVVRLEKKTGMIYLIQCSKRGRIPTHIKKVAALCIAAILLSFAVYAVDYLNTFAHYGAPYLGAPIQSLTFMKDITFHISIWQWIVILVLVKTALTAVIAVAAYFLAGAFDKLKNAMAQKLYQKV